MSRTYAENLLQGMALEDFPLWKRGTEGDLKPMALAKPCKSPLTPLLQRGESNIASFFHMAKISTFVRC